MRQTAKKAFYAGAYYTGAVNYPMKRLARQGKSDAGLVLFYHRFRKEKPARGLLPSLYIGEFEKQVQYLKRHYEMVSMDDLGWKLREGIRPTKPFVALTIDDGYRCNYELAFPIIKKYRLPVTIYITVGSIGHQANLWVDDLDQAIMKTDRERLCLDWNATIITYDLSTDKNKRRALKGIFKNLHHGSNNDRQEKLTEVFDRLGMDRDQLRAERRMMNWDEISSMSEYGVLFGAHTVTHPFLPVMDPDEARWEIRHSKDVVEQKLGRKARHFAIPNGKKSDFTHYLKRYCRELDFDTVVTTESGIVEPMSDRYEIRRVIPPPPQYYFACEVARYFLATGEVESARRRRSALWSSGETAGTES